MPDEPRRGDDSRIHHNTTDTRERAYARLRQDGVPRDVAGQIADQAVREAHDKLDRR